jgi:hypothetical protein
MTAPYEPTPDERRVIAWLRVPSWGELPLVWRLRFAWWALFSPHKMVNRCALTLADAMSRGDHIKTLAEQGAPE